MTNATIPQGWQCPSCRHVYAPRMPMCTICPGPDGKPKTATEIKYPNGLGGRRAPGSPATPFDPHRYTNCSRPVRVEQQGEEN